MPMQSFAGFYALSGAFFYSSTNAGAYTGKRKCICSQTQVGFTSNARAFGPKRKGVFGGSLQGEEKGKLDGLSGLAGIFINYIYAGCGTSLSYLFHTCI